MKIFKRILAGLAIVLILVIIGVFFFVRNIARQALPDYEQNIELSGLTGEVTIYRNKYAVPHIFAQNEYDLYLAVGYVMAQDRLWQMDLLRRVTSGRLSEIFGADMVNTDHLLRALRIPEKSEMVLAGSTPEILLALQAFSDGVNQFINKNQNNLPPEFTILGYKPEPWQPFHSVNLIGYLAWDLTGSWSTEVILHKLRNHLDEERFLELIPNLAHHNTYVHPQPSPENTDAMFSLLDGNSILQALGLEILSGSNNWAVSGKKSETGHPLLANDMHLGLNAPGIWYQMHHVIEGKLNVSGVALPGQPMIIAGHNERIAWGMTNVYVDDIDFFLETIDENNPDKYLFNGVWKNMEVREEKIAVKGGDTIVKENRFTHRGPIISDFKKVTDQAISMQWTGNLYSNELRSIYLLNRASNWDEFRYAVTTMTSVSQNFIYADVDGNIGLQTAAGVPVRKDGNAIFIHPGETEKFDWEGFLPFEKLPYSFNPPEGHISSANNRTAGADYPYYIGYWFAMPHRASRIIEMLNEKEKHGIADFKRMLGDFKSKHVEKYLETLVGILSNATNLTANELKALEILRTWDMVLTAECNAAPVFEKFYITFIKNTVKDEMGEELYDEFLGGGGLSRELFDHVWRNPASVWVDNVNTPEIEKFENIVLTSYSEAVNWLEETMGTNPDKWKWGELHQLTINHPMGRVKILERIFNLNIGPFPVGGSYHTVSPFGYSFRNPFAVNHGASQRHIYDLSDWNNSHVIIPTGTSGIPASKYYSDQTEMYLKNQYKTNLFTEEEVIKNARYVTRLIPVVPK